MSKRTPKAKTLRILDESTMTYRVANLYNVDFEMREGANVSVGVYAATGCEVMTTAARLYSGKGAFVRPLSFERA